MVLFVGNLKIFCEYRSPDPPTFFFVMSYDTYYWFFLGTTPFENKSMSSISHDYLLNWVQFAAHIQLREFHQQFMHKKVNTYIFHYNDSSVTTFPMVGGRYIHVLNFGQFNLILQITPFLIRITGYLCVIVSYA